MGIETHTYTHEGRSAYDIFKDTSHRQVKALMFHDQMADLFDFLGLRGFKRMHEYQYFSESMEHRGTKRYYLNHHNCMIMEDSIPRPTVIPLEWGQYERFDVTPQIRKQTVEKAFKEYREWEFDTKVCYDQYAKELMDLGAMADHHKIMDLVKDVDHELKCLDRLWMDLKAVSFNEIYMITIQEEIHEKYREKTKDLGIDIC